MARRKSMRGKQSNAKDSLADKQEAKQTESPEPRQSSRQAEQRMRTRQDANPERKVALQRLMEAFREGDLDSDLDDSNSADSNGENDPETSAGQMTRAKRVAVAKRHVRQRKQSARQKVNGEGESDGDYEQIKADDDDEDDDDDLEETGYMDDEELAESKNGSDHDNMAKSASRKQAAGKASREMEKQLILKLKTATRTKTNDASNKPGDHGEADDAPRLEDLDWSEFDLQTINDILARREALHKKRRMGAAKKKRGTEDDGHTTSPKLKRSSLAPAPLQLEPVREDIDEAVVNNGIDAASERYETERGNGEAMDVDVEGDRPDLGYLFDSAEAPPLSPGGSSLQLPPRTSAMNQETMELEADAGASGSGLRQGRPHPAFIRSIADSHFGTPRDMRIVLQYELKSEEKMLKDIRAEIMDKLSKLNTEEKLLRMIVKKDIDIGDDEPAAQNAGDISASFNSYIENGVSGSGVYTQPSLAAASGGSDEHAGFGFGMGLDMIANAGASDEDGNGSGSGSDSDDSLSGMSSSSSEDEVPDEEVTRGALNRVFMQYLPNEAAGEASSSP
ncbi:hypothetical protein EV175_001181 [Coemansia sp. RSA 1933]|nr:hypothetical protein EV175_001181 [Coemansia sp. RSA 1933]